MSGPGLARRLAAATTGAVLLAVSTIGALPSSATVVTPAWQPDANNLGPVSLYDAAGHVVTTGSINDVPMAAYYVVPGSPAAHHGYAATTTPETGNSATWSGTNVITSTQTFPKASLPGDLAGYTGPVVPDNSGSSFQANQITPYPNSSTTSGYQGLYEIRVYTGATASTTTTTSWYTVDIQVSGGTWTQVYPNVTTVPGAPTAVSATGQNQRALLSWTAPANTGGAPLTSYRVTATPSVGTPVVAQTGTAATAYTLTGLVNGTAYTVTVAAINTAGTGADSAGASVTPVAPTGAVFTALAPVRILDTRFGVGRPGTAPLGTTKIDLQVTGLAGVPDDASSVVLNVTAVAPSGGYITVWPAGEALPTASNINTVKGNNIPNLVIAKLGTGGKVSLKNSLGTTHLLADVGGYYSTSTSGQEFTPLQPVRLLDTRLNSGAPLGAGQTRTVDTTGDNLKPGLSIPANASAVVVNVTAVKPTANGYVTVYPSGSTRPTTSNLNLQAGVNAPNLVTVKVGTDAVGGITLFNSGGTTHLLVDIAGYYSPTSSSSFVAVSPQRLLDTRKSVGVNTTSPITPSTPVLLDVRGGGVPSGATAVVLNVIAIAPTLNGGYITVYPGGTAKPIVSNLNNTTGVTRANLVIVKVGAGGINDGIVRLEISGGSTHMVADVAGYFVS